MFADTSMVHTERTADLAWVRTDPAGQIEGLSRSASELLGSGSGRGQNLLLFFPVHTQELAFDMDVALTGWPSRGVATLESMARRRLTVRYTVSPRVVLGGVALYWFFDVVEVSDRSASSLIRGSC